MSGSQWKVAALTFVLLLVPVAHNIYNYAVTDFIAQPPPTYCQAVPNMTPKRKKLVIVTRGAMLVGDVLVIIVTWMKTYRTVRLTADVGIRVSFSRLLFRDGASILPFAAARLSSMLTPMARAGAIYFIVMSFLNAFQIVVTFVETRASFPADLLFSRTLTTPQHHGDPDLALHPEPARRDSAPPAPLRATPARRSARRSILRGTSTRWGPPRLHAVRARRGWSAYGRWESESGGSVDADTDADADTDMVSDVEGV
ncbi:hypothetical protein A0H81_07323 [Grifola frondosa]|uniref:Uncharacterized protein n=1 Tax=Grifola frondosa TaxID=5627 RepID=A0A1C7M8G2_GRIFR|nr:hypothetical protein A0H81_07323 [Grifola frondosa]